MCVCAQAEEAEATYRTCIADASTHQQELEDVKVNVLRQIQDLIKQTDQTLRTVSPQSNTKAHSFSHPSSVSSP